MIIVCFYSFNGLFYTFACINLEKMLQERKLLKELTEGSELSFNVLYNLWASRLYYFAFSYLKSDSAAKDVVQETFVKIWANREKINPDLSFKAYLFTHYFGKFLPKN